MREIIYGIHAVKALLDRKPDSFQNVFILKQRKDDKKIILLRRSLEKYGVIIQLKDRHFLNKKSGTTIHQGIVGYVKSSQQFQEKNLPNFIDNLNNPFFLILDGVTDPHNFGACLRTASAAGVHAVIIPKNRSVQLNAAAKKVACGAAENIPLIRVTNLVRTIQFLQQKSFWIIGTVSKANCTLYQRKITTGPLALVMGAEGDGMRYLTYKNCNELISIPMPGSANMPSLNVSVAAGICLFDIARYRK